MRPSAAMAVVDDRRVAASRCSAAESWGWPSGAADRTIPKSFGLEAATHRLLWAGKDSSVSEGDDLGWVDYFQWTGATEPLEEAGPDQWDTITYVYDPAGRRMAKAFDGQVAVRYLYDGDHCIAEYDADDVLLRRFIYGPGVDQPICMIEADGPYAGAYYYHFDGLGSVVALSDASGDTVQTYEYSVFGRPAAADPNHPNPYLFTARRFDPETGLYHYRARAYNPYIGRFLQTDPAGQGRSRISSFVSRISYLVKREASFVGRR